MDAKCAHCKPMIFSGLEAFQTVFSAATFFFLSIKLYADAKDIVSSEKH